MKVPPPLDRLASLPAELWVGLSILSVVLAVVSLALMPRLLVGLPQNYLAEQPVRLGQRWARADLGRRLLIVLRNLAGAVLLVLGVVMLFVPGQGVLTMIAGLALLDLPGRRALLVWLLQRPQVARTVDRMRQRAGAPPLDPPLQP